MSSLDLPPHVPDYSHATGQCLVHLKLCLLAFIGLEPPPRISPEFAQVAS